MGVKIIKTGVPKDIATEISGATFMFTGIDGTPYAGYHTTPSITSGGAIGIGSTSASSAFHLQAANVVPGTLIGSFHGVSEFGVLVEAIQQLKDKHDHLESVVSALEDRNMKLEAQVQAFEAQQILSVGPTGPEGMMGPPGVPGMPGPLESAGR